MIWIFQKWNCNERGRKERTHSKYTLIPILLYYSGTYGQTLIFKPVNFSVLCKWREKITPIVPWPYTAAIIFRNKMSLTNPIQNIIPGITVHVHFEYLFLVYLCQQEGTSILAVNFWKGSEICCSTNLVWAVSFVILTPFVNMDENSVMF